MIRATVFALTLASGIACSDKTTADTAPSPEPDDEADSGGGGTGGTGGDGTGGGSGTSSSDQPPTMTATDAYCYIHSTGEERWIWVVLGQADDPQGIDTLEAIVPEGVIIESGGAEVGRLDLACDTQGACSAMFDEASSGASCQQAASTTFSLFALDEDGNRSAPATITGRLQQ